MDLMYSFLTNLNKQKEKKKRMEDVKRDKNEKVFIFHNSV